MIISLLAGEFLVELIAAVIGEIGYLVAVIAGVGAVVLLFFIIRNEERKQRNL